MSEIREAGTQAGVVESMQTRDELYEMLDYMSYELRLDELFGNEKGEEGG